MASPEWQRNKDYLRECIRAVEGLRLDTAHLIRTEFRRIKATWRRLGLQGYQGWTPHRLDLAQQFMGSSFFRQEVSIGDSLGPQFRDHIGVLEIAKIEFRLVSFDESRGIIAKFVSSTGGAKLTDQGYPLKFEARLREFSLQFKKDGAGYRYPVHTTANRELCSQLRARFIKEGMSGIWLELDALWDETFADLPAVPGRPRCGLGSGS